MAAQQRPHDSKLNWTDDSQATVCPISPEHTILYRGLGGKRGDNAPTMCLPGQVVSLAVCKDLSCAFVFQTNPFRPWILQRRSIFKAGFSLISPSISPHILSWRVDKRARKGPACPWWGIIFTYCQMEDITRYQDLLSPFIPVALDEAKIWRGCLTDAFSNRWSLRLFMCKEENVLLGEFPSWALMAPIFMCLFGAEENTEHYVLGQNISDHSMFFFF